MKLDIYGMTYNLTLSRNGLFIPLLSLLCVFFTWLFTDLLIGGTPPITNKENHDKKKGPGEMSGMYFAVRQAKLYLLQMPLSIGYTCPCLSNILTWNVIFNTNAQNIFFAIISGTTHVT